MKTHATYEVDGRVLKVAKDLTADRPFRLYHIEKKVYGRKLTLISCPDTFHDGMNELCGHDSAKTTEQGD